MKVQNDKDFTVFWNICDATNNYCLASPFTKSYIYKGYDNYWLFGAAFAIIATFVGSIIAWKLYCEIIDVACGRGNFKLSHHERCIVGGLGFPLLSNASLHFALQGNPIVIILEWVLPDALLSFIIGFFKTVGTFGGWMHIF
jgi:hypothetical protein